MWVHNWTILYTEVNSSTGTHAQLYTTPNILPLFTFLQQHKFYIQSQRCGSGMFIPDPGSWFLPIPIPDPRSKNSSKREGWKKICCHTFFCSHKFHLIENYFIFEMLKKNIWANFQRIIKLFTQKIVTMLSKLSVWDPGSGKNYSGSRIQGPKKYRIPDPQHCTEPYIIRALSLLRVIYRYSTHLKKVTASRIRIRIEQGQPIRIRNRMRPFDLKFSIFTTLYFILVQSGNT